MILTWQEEKEQLLLLIDDEEWLFVDKKLFKRKLPLLRACQSREDLERLFHKIEAELAKGYAFRLLAMRSFPTEQLRQKLQRKHFRDETIAALLDECTQLGYLNDTEVAARFVQQQIQKGRGPHFIRQELLKKGFSPELVEEHLETLFPEDRQREALETLLRTKFSRSSFDDSKELRKVFASLVRLGFPQRLIRESLQASRS